MEYTHPCIGDTVEFLAGSYEIESENRLERDDGEVLYLVGNTSQLCGCCGSCGGMAFITVPGFIKAWKTYNNERGLPVSEIEVVKDPEIKREIREMLEASYGKINIEFW